MQGIWTCDRVQLLKVMYEAGASFRDIANEIGVSRNAAIGKAHRLNCPPRPNPVVPPRPRAPTAPRRPRAARTPKIAPAARLEQALAVPIEPGRDYRCTIDELGNCTCRFPLWSAFDPAKLYCGRPGADLAEDRPYCDPHAKFCGSRR